MKHRVNPAKHGFSFGGGHILRSANREAIDVIGILSFWGLGTRGSNHSIPFSGPTRDPRRFLTEQT
jgi:hypothetical protein